MRKKKSTQQLVGIESVTDSSVLTAGGELSFYFVQPTNLNVLPEAGVRGRVTALLGVLKGMAEVEMLALDSKESYQDNRLYYRRRTEAEGNPAILLCKMCVCQTDGRDGGIGMILLFLLPETEKAFLLVDCGADLPRRVAGGIDGGAEGVFVQRLSRENHRLPLEMGGRNLFHGKRGANGVVDVRLAHRAGHAGNLNCCLDHFRTSCSGNLSRDVFRNAFVR